MSINELEQKVYSISSWGRGQTRYLIEYRGEVYDIVINDTVCLDRINEHDWGEYAENERNENGITYKDALEYLYRKGIEQI